MGSVMHWIVIRNEFKFEVKNFGSKRTPVRINPIFVIGTEGSEVDDMMWAVWNRKLQWRCSTVYNEIPIRIAKYEANTRYIEYESCSKWTHSQLPLLTTLQCILFQFVHSQTKIFLLWKPRCLFQLNFFLTVTILGWSLLTYTDWILIWILVFHDFIFIFRFGHHRFKSSFSLGFIDYFIVI